MRLLAITNDFPPTVGGIENYEYSLISRWDPDQVTVLTRWVPGCEDFDKGLGFDVRRVPVGTLLPTPSLLRLARSVIASDSIDVIHFPSSLPLGLMGPRLLRSTDTPYCISVHGGEFMLPRSIPGLKRALASVIEDACVVFPESSFAESLVDGFVEVGPPLERVTCGVDVNAFKKDSAARAELGFDGPTILSVSRLVARKGPATLIKAMPEVLLHDPTVELVIVGGGPDRKRLEKLSRSLGIESKVRFTGPMQWDEVARYYAGADVFAMPTRERFAGIETEGLPLVFVEAAASSLPLVGGIAGGVSDAVREGETGFLVDGRVPRQTAEVLIELIEDEDLRRRMGTAARKMAELEFTWEIQFARFQSAIEKYC
ncbi:MAG: glycosyltransferase family 4 protein [Actinomycetota bacterium]|nr:glycosyltransferase family 4 protein [Actinomycetota bacterium]